MEGQNPTSLGSKTPAVTSTTELQEVSLLSSKVDSSMASVIDKSIEDSSNDQTQGICRNSSNDDVGAFTKIKDVHEEVVEEKYDKQREMAEACSTDEQTSDSLQDITGPGISHEQNTSADAPCSEANVKLDPQEGRSICDSKSDSSEIKKIGETHDKNLVEDTSVELSDVQDTYVDVPISGGKPLECLEIGAKDGCQSDTKSSEILRGILIGKNVSALGSNAHVMENQAIIDDQDTSHPGQHCMPSDHTKSINVLSSERNDETFDENTSIGKPVSQMESDVQRRVVNVYIVWNDGETEEQSILKWNHPNCNDCRDKYNDLKHHVYEKHNVDEVINSNIEADGGSALDRSSFDLGKRSQVVVKTEALDDTIDMEPKSSLDISVPHLVNVTTQMENTQKKGKKRAAIQRAKKVSAVVEKHDLKPDVKEEVHDDEVREMNSTTSIAPNKRKLGRPKKVREEPKEPDLSDTDHSDDGDPDYQPYEQVNKNKDQNKKRLGRPKKTIASVAKKEYECTHDSCDMVFNRVKDRKNHEKEAHVEHFLCEFEGCGMVFKTAHQKMKHSVDKHDGMFECEHCDLTFKDNREYIAHSSIHVSIKCDYENCGKSFATEHYLKAHKANQHRAKTFICPVCQKAYGSKRQLNQHMKIHTERTFQCEHCPKLFKSKFAVDKHMRIHTGIGLLVCQFCGKKLNGKPSLDRHERVHKGEKPYKCKYCDKGFVCQNSLDNHEQEHTGKQFVCDVCGKKCKTKGALKEHLRSHTGERPFKCDVCDKTYLTGGALWIHKTSKHLGFKRYECDVCGKQFRRSHGLTRHQTVHTGIRRFECKYCHKMFRTSGVRRGHYKQVHLGIKRRGHQGNAKRIKDEAKMLAEAKELLSDDTSSMEQTNEGMVTKIEQSDISSSSITHGLSQESMTGRRIHGIHPSLLPVNFSYENKQGIIPHSILLDSSRSDFHTMADSFIQFSKKH